MARVVVADDCWSFHRLLVVSAVCHNARDVYPSCALFVANSSIVAATAVLVAVVREVSVEDEQRVTALMYV